MGLTYFKRYRMELDLERTSLPDPLIPHGFELLAWSDTLLRQHALAKYESFRWEMDANVFPCLGRRDGCLRLMREIARRRNFVPEATWLVRAIDPTADQADPIATVQGLAGDGCGMIQNLGVARGYRGQGLGSLLLARAARGFLAAGLPRMELEVTTDNAGALRLYERFGFRRLRTVFKAAEIAAV